MIKLYGIDVSFPVNRVRLCLNAMGQDYEYIRINPLAGETQTEEYLKMSPAGKIPGIDIDGFQLFESNAIMRYLCKKFDSDLYPADLESQAKVDAWLDFTAIHVSNGIGRVLFNKIVASMIEAEVDERSLQEGYGFIERFFTVVDGQLGNSDYVAGDKLSIAELGLLATIDPSEVLEVDLASYPNLNSWARKLMAEEFYQKMHSSYAAALEALMKAMSEG